ncbi:MAG TPA: M3 family oligoendopeptidase [Phaeodactylibacter sp.]|nr:M3 family oligoendopeptidase [Phaeodactylibacter sp.]
MNNLTTSPLKKRPRTYLPDEFKLSVWSKVRPYFNELLRREIQSVEDLEEWLLDRSELIAIIREEFNWRYINISRNTEDQEATELYEYGVQELSPKIAPLENQLNEKLLNSPFTAMLPKQKYFIHLRSVKNGFELFQKENIPLFTQDNMLAKKYGMLFSKMSITIEGKEYTFQQAASFLEKTDRNLREKVYKKIAARTLQDSQPIDELMTELVTLRHQIALNADFKNYRDYKFKALGRFDYSVEDCYDFHEAIAEEILPLEEHLAFLRKKEMGVEELKPWDLQVDAEQKTPLKPFENANELVAKSIQCLNKIHPFFGACIATMQEMGRLDLGSRRAKRPGGYNMPLPMTGAPFIFMNAAGTLKDVTTMVHESGHAVHSFLTHHLKLNTNKRVPSEVAELASMTMELLSMDAWDVFFPNKEDLRRAKIRQLERIIKVLPWIAAIDKFQHWLYLHPHHTTEERTAAWLEIYKKLSPSTVDWSGMEDYRGNLWHRQLHIFEVPFYYIEYGFAQLGAIAIWKNYKANPEKTLQQYTNALQLGYTKPIGEIYKTAGIEFNFSKKYVSELGDFIKKELESLTLAEKMM